MKSRWTAKYFTTTLIDTDTKANGLFQTHCSGVQTFNQPPSPAFRLGDQWARL